MRVCVDTRTAGIAGLRRQVMHLLCYAATCRVKLERVPYRFVQNDESDIRLVAVTECPPCLRAGDTVNVKTVVPLEVDDPCPGL